MTDGRSSQSISKIPSWLQKLVEPPKTLPEPERRRMRVLTVINLALLLSSVAFAVLILIVSDRDLLLPYLVLMAVLILFFALAYYLNATGHYTASAMMVVGLTAIGPWGSILIDQTLIRSDIQLSYLAISILLSSLLLRTRYTLILICGQLAAMILMPIFNPSITSSNFPSLVGFFILIALLSMASNFVSRQDLIQIDRQTSQLIENEQKLRELSVRDPLTGLFNRRYLEETLEREMRRTDRKGTPLGIIMADVDNFKTFNDTYGHIVGDELLRQVAQVLQRHVRGYDIPCRYGGEEFILIMPDANWEVLQQRAELLLQNIKTLSRQVEGQQTERMTISVGVAVYPENGSTADELLRAVDDALYEAKGKGRDQVAIARNRVKG